MKNHLYSQFHLIQAIRDFFAQNDFLDVLTPPVVSNPGMEVHIHPFQLTSARDKQEHPLYLHTSPEFHMKELLSQGFERIFTIAYCFRDEPMSPIHRSQFLMLEWYRGQSPYEQIMEDCQQLTSFCQQYLHQRNLLKTPRPISFERLTVQELFLEHLKVDILSFLDTNELRLLLQKNYPEIPLPATPLEWDDYFFLLFLNKIEPLLIHHPFLILYEFPHHLCALSKLKESDPRVCQRFEMYIDGIELANCFAELTDPMIQRQRFADQHQLKNRLYGYQLPEPHVLYRALERGLSPSSGIALGIERLLKALTQQENIFWE